jgi:hypothetical protein
MLPASPLLHTATTPTQQNTQQSSNRKEQHMYSPQIYQKQTQINAVLNMKLNSNQKEIKGRGGGGGCGGGGSGGGGCGDGGCGCCCGGGCGDGGGGGGDSSSSQCTGNGDGIVVVIMVVVITKGNVQNNKSVFRFYYKFQCKMSDVTWYS